jgi:hypothetical protein
VDGAHARRFDRGRSRFDRRGAMRANGAAVRASAEERAAGPADTRS